MGLYTSDMTYPTLKHEEELWKLGHQRICGIDEVGRGCFAGPIVAAGVIFPRDVVLPQGLNDSKLMTAKKRVEVAALIKNLALDWKIVEIGVEVINEQGIGKANKIAFQKVMTEFSTLPDFVLIDAFKLEDFDTSRQLPIVHGDQISASIAAASVLAKVYRDQLMETLDSQFPGYGFAKHKGYGTKAHRDALKQLGLSPLHRTSFNLTKFL